MKRRTLDKYSTFKSESFNDFIQLDLFKFEKNKFSKSFEKFEYLIENSSIEGICEELKFNGSNFFISIFKEDDNKILEKFKNKNLFFIIKNSIENNWIDGVSEENIVFNIGKSNFKNIDKFDIIIELIGEPTITSKGKTNFLDRKELDDYLKDYLYYYGISSNDCFLKLLTASKMIDFKINTLDNVKNCENKIFNCKKLNNLINYKKNRSSFFSFVDDYWQKAFFNSFRSDYQDKYSFKKHFNNFNETENLINKLEDKEFVVDSLSSFWFYLNHFSNAYKNNNKALEEEIKYKIFSFFYENLLNYKNEKIIEINSVKGFFSKEISQAFQLKNDTKYSVFNQDKEQVKNNFSKNRF